MHVIAPELGLSQPGMTVACGDSHTSTHGAFGAIAFGIGTSQVRDVLASQSLAMGKLKVRRIWVDGALQSGVYAKDLVLHVIRTLGVKGGVGYAYEFAGPAIDVLSMEERMTLCNMAIEGGARCGYVNPDQVTFDYLKGRPFAPSGAAWDQAVAWWSSLASGPDAMFDDEVRFLQDIVRFPSLRGAEAPLLVHAPSCLRRLGVSMPVLDLLDLFAFVLPARAAPPEQLATQGAMA